MKSDKNKILRKETAKYNNLRREITEHLPIIEGRVEKFEKALMKPEESDKHQPAIGHKIPRLNVWQRTSRMGLFFNLNGEILYNKEIRIKPKIHITKL